MATTKAYELGQLGSILDVDSANNITLSGTLDTQYSGFDSDFTAKSTSDLSEGSNLYYTDNRADTRINLQTGSNLDLSSKSTTDLSEGSNLYYTDTRADARIAAATTADLTEGSNLYYTTARGDSDTGVYISGNRSYGNITTTGYIAGPATMTIDPAAVGDNTGTLVVAGNLQVDGTTTTINSTTLEVEDKNVVLGPNAANDAANNGAGLTVTQPDTSNATLIYDTTSTQWEFNKDLDVAGDITVSGTVDGVDIASRDSTLTSTTTTANAALPKAGGTMTGALIVNAGDNGLDVRVGTDKRILFAGNIGEIGSVAGFQAVNTAGSANTAFGIRATDIRFATGSDERVRITDTGVGIGTDNPDALLHVQHTSADQAFIIANRYNDTSTGSDFRAIFAVSEADPHSDGTTATIIGNHNRHIHIGSYFDVDGTTNAVGGLTILSSGNVGIGTSSPGEKLDVNGVIRSLGNNDANYSTSLVGRYDSTHPMALYVRGNSATNSEILGVYADAGGANLRTVINPSNGWKVGIGTTSPAANLEVANGDLAVSAGHIGIGLSTPSQYGSGVPTLHLQGTSPANTRAGAIYFTENTGDQTGAIYSTDGSDGYGGIILHSAQGDMKFSTGALQDYRIVIDTSGNVGIGTTNPGRKLDINGAGSGDVVGIKGGSYNQVNIAHGNNSSWGLLLGNSDATSNSGYHYSTSGENTSAAVVNVNNDALHFGTNNDPVMTINHSGNVSIGVNNTSYGKLDVYREPASGWTRSITRNNGGSAFVGVYKTTTPNTTNSPGIFAHSAAVNAWADLWINAHDNGSGGVGGGTSQSIFMAGNVGINTKPVNNTLQVSGAADRAAISVTNADLGNLHYTNRNGRYLTSNGAGWTSGIDGADPGIVIGGDNSSGQIKGVGIVLHNDNNGDNQYSPTISFGTKSNSGSYNTSYAHIIGRKTGQGADPNWSAGELGFYTQPVGGYVTNETRMIIKENGRVGIGTSSPSINKGLHIRGGLFIDNQTADPNNVSGDDQTLWVKKEDNKDWVITADGYTGTSTDYGIRLRTTTSAVYGIALQAGGSYRFRVQGDGNVLNSNNSYGSISDIKLKENIVDAASQWDDIKAIRVRKYSFISDNLDAPNQLGVIAQEVEEAGMGGLVLTTPDIDENKNLTGFDTKEVKYSILYMKAIKALQEAMSRIETLETEMVSVKSRIEALEG